MATPRIGFAGRIVTFAIAFTACAALIDGQEQVPLQFNVPYRCPNGITYTITKCTGTGYKEVCTWREEQNGHLVTEAYSQRVYMGGRLAPCKVDSVAQSPSAQVASSHPTDPPYLVEMPSVEKVKSTIQGTSPDDTLARQTAVFTYLPQIVLRMQDRHRPYGSVTPDEQRITGAYSLAAYQISQEYAKSHTPEQAKEFERLHGRYEMDSTFFREWFSALFTPEFRAAYSRAVSGRMADYQAHVAKEQQQYDQATARQKQAAAQGPQGGLPNDPGRVAVRKCLESGRSQMECLGEGLKVGFGELVGDPTALTGNTPQGLRLNGIYSTSRLQFNFSAANVVMGCGTLVPQNLPYVVERTGNRVVVKVQSSPRPIAMVLNPNGKLAGPGPVEIAGLVVAGHGGGQASAWAGSEPQTHTTTVQTQIPAADVANHPIGEVNQNGMEYSTTQQVTTTSEPGWSAPHYQSVPTVPKTERCDATILSPTSGSSGFADLLTGAFGSDPGKVPKMPPGLRLSGTYAAPGGLHIEFRDDSATLECGEAHVAQPYVAQNSGGQITVKVRNGTEPVTLTLQPNGTLNGAGTVQVNGRVVVGHRGNEILYAPRTASCNLGTMSLVQAAR